VLGGGRTFFFNSRICQKYRCGRAFPSDGIDVIELDFGTLKGCEWFGGGEVVVRG